ncbi:uncharacterized protein M6B38_164675 [Iris pallida]|uniref:KAT8 regulatory NSL complex subunit 2 n=1 Tax=Iris pallida TaxID=29817 RepID=A0AAX6ETE1_IRIPA|nr:uncharacterized protein M6B38_106525 [Iris pallida]KAJ6808626.1 uncharacterized protein M6B38_164675 [Iris pallida]
MKRSDSEILHQPLLLLPPPPPHIPNPEQEPPNPNPNPSHGRSDPIPTPSPTAGANQIPNAGVLSVLSREEVLRRRFRCLKKLSRLYRDQYWALAEEIRVRHRDFYWQHGKSPLEEEGEEGGGGGGSGLGLRENGGVTNGERKKCAFSGCKSHSMPLTAFCHQHILSDREQKLYRPCCFVIRSIQSGQIICRKPVSAVPSLCPVHLQKTQRNISVALRKAGLTTSSPPKFHELVHELLGQINDRRRKKQKCRGNLVAEEESNRK